MSPLSIFLVLFCPVHTQHFLLPEGTEAGLKGVNSSDGVWWASVGSRVLAGDAGVCGRGES